MCLHNAVFVACVDRHLWGLLMAILGDLERKISSSPNQGGRHLFHYFWIKKNGVPKKTVDTALLSDWNPEYPFPPIFLCVSLQVC